MRKSLVSCLLSSVCGALGDRALPFVLAAVVVVTATPMFGAGAERIDLSSYFVSTNYLNCVAERTEKPTFSGGVLAATSGQTLDFAKPCAGGLTFGEGLTNLAARVAAMEADGVDTALLGSFVQVWDLPEEDAIRVARESNNDIARAMKAYPGRFEGAALLPIVQGSDTCVDAAIAELERCVNEYGFRVWIASSNFGADHLYDAKFEPLLKLAEQLGVKIYLNDAYPIEEPFAALDGEDDPNEWGLALSNGQDLMVTATLMVMNGTFDRYPTLRVILPNLGEYLPFNLDRISFMLANSEDLENVQCEKTLFHYAVTNKNFILTTSGGTNEIPFMCAKRVMGADRLCFGTGWPFGDMKAQADAVEAFDLTDAERDGVLSQNARKYVLDDGPGEVITKPWLQNVYTNRFTVMCETKGVMVDLALQYGEGYSLVAPMAYVEGLKEGTYVYKAEVVMDGAEGATIPYRLAADGPLAGTEGSVRLWKDEDAAFTCAIWGDNQEGVHGYDWGNDVTDERYRCIRSMFSHMAKQCPDFGFTTGDMSSSALYDKEILPGELRGLNDLFGCKIPYHLVWGNHDCNGTFFGEVYTNAVQRYFSPAASEEDGWFHLYRNDVLFIGVHWTWGQDGAEERYDAITNGVARLLATDRAKNAKFRVLMQHAPIFLECYNVLPKADWFSDTRLLDVAKAGGVDVVFSGHTHAYERIERDGLVQIVNGGMGYLDHGERWYNNCGSDTKVGGHNSLQYLWARQESFDELALGPMEPVRMGCLQGYGTLEVKGDTLKYRQHAFNADGSYIGVCDSFELTSRTVREPVKSSGTKGVSIGLDLSRPIDNATWSEYKTAIGEEFAYDPFHAHDPVVNVSKTEIGRFCAALNAADASKNYRLPTESELREIFGGELRREVSEWTSDVDPVSGYCRILGGNAKAIDGTWCRAEDRPAVATAECHANYLGFRLVTGPRPAAVTNEMDKALAALAKIKNPAEIYEWNSSEGILSDITADWTDEKLPTKYSYANPVIFTGSGDLEYRVRREITFGGGLAAPNATRLDLSHRLGLAAQPLTIRGEFVGGVATNEWEFALKADELTLDGVTYRGQVFEAITDSRELRLLGTNDFSCADMTLCSDRKYMDGFVTNLVVAGDGSATMYLRRFVLTNRGIVEEVLGSDTANLTVGKGVTLTLAQDVVLGIDGGSLTVDGTLKAAGIDFQGHLMGLLNVRAAIGGSGTVETTHFGLGAKTSLQLGVSNLVLLSSCPWRAYVPCETNDAYEIVGGVRIVSRRPWTLDGDDRFGWPYVFAGEAGASVTFSGDVPVAFLPAECDKTLDVLKDVMLGEGAAPIYSTLESAEKATAAAMVERPDAVKGVVDAPNYDAYFDIAPVSSGDQWTLAYALSAAVTNEVHAAIDDMSVKSNLVATITEETPSTIVQTKAGLYYGMAGATNAAETAEASVAEWTLGDGQAKEIGGMRPKAATDRAFYQLRVSTRP